MSPSGICAWLLALGLLLMTLPQAGAASTFDVKNIEASVYKIYTMKKKGIGTGTGFLVNGRRTLVTNFHVVAEGEKYFVGYRDTRGDGRLVEARVVERRANIDLAVLEAYEDLPGRDLALGDFEPEKLTNVIAVGFPGAADVKQDTTARTLPELYARMKEPSGFDSTLTPGVVSRIYSASNTALSETQIINARTVQHNAPINPGNSGGPLFDECGTVIGVNSFSPKGAQGLFFSIHSGEVIRFLRELNIPYSSVNHACLAASLSSGGGLVLPLIIGMAAALAVVAVLFAWRGGAAVGAVGQYMSRRLTGIRERGSPGAGREGGAKAAPAPINFAPTAAALSLQPVGGGKGFALEAGRTAVIGRGRQCEYTVENDDTISSAHARLEVDARGQRVTVTDLNSSNGTFVNGRRINSAQVQVGDTLRFGSAEFKVAVGASAAPAAAAGRASAPDHGWMLSGFDPSGRALQFELRPAAPNGRAEGATWTIGRDRNRAQFVIDDDSVSGAHAQIAYDTRQGLTLRDLGSTNGTRLDGTVIGTRTATLSDTGQEITFGAAKLRLSRLIR